MASDQVVTSKDVLQATLQLGRVGTDRLLKELEALEPDLAEFVFEQSSSIHQRLLTLGGEPRRVRRIFREMEKLVLVAVLSLRNAHRRLWQEEAAGTPLAQLDPPTGECTSGAELPPPDEDNQPKEA